MGILVALPIATAMALFTKKKIEELIFPAISIIIFEIIITGYFGSTRVGVVLALLTGVFAFIYSVYFFIKHKEKFENNIFTPGLSVLVIFCFIMILFHAGRTIQDGDSCRVYGPQMLNMYLYSDLGGKRMAEGEVRALLYSAPISAAWGYFCNILWYKYSDGVFAWARSIYSLSALLPAFTLIKRKEYIKYLSLIVIILQLFSNSYTDFANDGILEAAVLYSLIMVINLFCRSEVYNDKTYLICTCCGATVACMVKRAGALSLFGTIFILVFFTLDRIIYEKENSFFKKIIPIFSVWIACLLSSTFLIYKYVYGLATVKDIFIPIILITGFIVGAVVFWIVRRLILKKNYFYALIILSVFMIIGMGLCYGYIVHSETVEDAETIFYSFWKAWILKEGITDASYVRHRFIPDALIWCLCLFILWIIKQMIHNRIIQSNENERNYESLVTSVYSGVLVVVVLWCLMYITRVGYIASFVRYMTPTVATLGWVLIYEILMIKSQDSKVIYAGVAAIITLVTVYNPFKVIFDRPIGRTTYEETYKNAGVYLTPNDRIFFIEGREYETRVFNYASYPAYCDKLDGEKYKKGIEEDKENGITPQELSDYLNENGFNYVYLEKIGKDFCKNYTSLFDGGEESIKDYSIYSVEKREGSLVELRLLGSSDTSL